MKWIRRVAVALAGAVLIGALAGCASSPPAGGAARVGSAAGIALPIAARVAVQVDPSMPDTQTVEFRGESWQYDDANLMQEAAMRVFGQVFQEVGTGPTMSAPTLTLQLNGSSSLNPVMNEYFANATVTVFAGANTDVQPIASFAGTGQAGQADFGRGGIEQAYEGAFRQAAELLLMDPHLIASVRGY